MREGNYMAILNFNTSKYEILPIKIDDELINLEVETKKEKLMAFMKFHDEALQLQNKLENSDTEDNMSEIFI